MARKPRLPFSSLKPLSLPAAPDERPATTVRNRSPNEPLLKAEEQEGVLWKLAREALPDRKQRARRAARAKRLVEGAGGDSPE